MFFDNSTFIINSFGAQLTNGLLGFQNSVLLDINSTDSSDGLIIGDGTASNDCKFWVYPSARFSIEGGDVTYKNINTSSWKMTNEYSSFILKSGATLRLEESLNIGTGILKTPNVRNIVKLSGKSLTGNVLITAV